MVNAMLKMPTEMHEWPVQILKAQLWGLDKGFLYMMLELLSWKMSRVNHLFLDEVDKNVLGTTHVKQQDVSWKNYIPCSLWTIRLRWWEMKLHKWVAD